MIYMTSDYLDFQCIFPRASFIFFLQRPGHANARKKIPSIPKMWGKKYKIFVKFEKKINWRTKIASFDRVKRFFGDASRFLEQMIKKRKVSKKEARR